MSRRAPLPVTLTLAPFATRELDDSGIPRDRLRASDIAHPFHGVNSLGVTDGLRERCEALNVVLRGCDAFSHLTAVALVGAPLPHSRDQRLHVTTIGGPEKVRRQGVSGHTAARLPVTVHLGLPVVAPAHAWVQCATLLPLDALIAIGDFLVTPDRHRRTSALTTRTELEAATSPGARGAARARSALREVRPGAESPMETRLRLLLMRSGLPEPLLNPAVRVGDRVLHPDILYPGWRVAIEYEGDQHRTDARQWRDDIRRAEWFAEGGWRVLRVTKDDVLKEPEQLLARVCRVLAKRAPAG